jgi:hypothetical protein
VGLLDGKVAVVSGAARGQGRAHAVRLARDGADIIAMDICADIDTVHYPLATRADLVETVAQVERLGRRIVATQTDVRDSSAVAAAIDSGVRELGRLNIVLANAGIATYAPADKMPEPTWRDMIDTTSPAELLAPGSGPSAATGAEHAPADVVEGFKGINAMPVAWAEPEDITEAVLVSDSGRFITGSQLSVDGGAAAK